MLMEMNVLKARRQRIIRIAIRFMGGERGTSGLDHNDPLESLAKSGSRWRVLARS
jgi:hypothetical protein